MNPRRARNLRDSSYGDFTTIGTSGHANVNNVGRDMNIQIYNERDARRISLHPGFVVPDASYKGHDTRVGCLKGTRTLAIAKISTWKNDINANPLCWMSGPAGFGKSAISQTVAESCARNKTLAASFFFSRGAGGRSKIVHFVTTLAFQITISVPGLKPLVEKALQDDPTIPDQSIANQLQSLIFEPLMAFRTFLRPRRTVLVVVDGLDECDDRKLIQEVITALAGARHVGPALTLRWLLTSRGEEHIRQSFSSTVCRRTTTLLQLESIHAHDDIKMFLEATFSDITQHSPRLFLNIPRPWPSSENLNALVQNSSGMFIFASTLAKFVTDGQAPPDRKLESVLKMHAGLDPLYTQVLRDVPQITCFDRVLTTLMLLYEQPSVEELAELLELKNQDVLHALLTIQSIIHIPANDNHPIQLNHASLRDFLVDESRSNDLFIDPPIAHASIFAVCVKILERKLELDIIPKNEAERYAAKYWPRHLLDSHNASEASPKLADVLQGFSSSQVIEPWINILIARGECKQTVDQLIDLAGKYEV
ncbi:hypothetical protein HWV62_39842 [Athelia sp. TMB]|nr:hypothetical protein HWV62_39842 [Athelia sp. TMB]